MELIGYSIVSAILPWPRIIVPCLKDGLSIDRLVISLFFKWHSSDSVHRMRFCFGVELVIVHSRTNTVCCFFLEPGSLGVEVALTAHVMAGFLVGLEVVLARAWHFLFFELFDLAEAVSWGMEAGIYCLCSFKGVIIIAWPWMWFFLFLDRLSQLPSNYSLRIERSTDIIWAWMRSIYLWWLYFLHLILLVFLEAKIIDRNGRNCWFDG